MAHGDSDKAKLYDYAITVAQEYLSKQASTPGEDRSVAKWVVQNLMRDTEWSEAVGISNLVSMVYAMVHRIILIPESQRASWQSESPASEKSRRREEAQKYRSLFKEKSRNLTRAELVILLLYYFQEWSVKDIAKSLDLSSNRTAQMLDAARKRIGFEEIVPQSKAAASPKPAAATQALGVVVDADVDPDLLVGFLVELASFYFEISGGDDLVIREGKIPIEVGVFV